MAQKGDRYNVFVQEQTKMMSNNVKWCGWSFRHDKCYNSDPLNGKFTFTIIKKIRQVFILRVRKVESRTFLPVMSMSCRRDLGGVAAGRL